MMQQLRLLWTRYDAIDPTRIGDLGPLNVQYLDTAQLPHLPSSIGGLACRRGDRIDRAMSAIGTKRTSLVAPHMSAFGGRADMTFCAARVRL